MKLILSIVILLVFTACNKKTERLLSSEQDCYPHRKVILSFDNEPGVISKVGEYYIISDRSGKRRYQPCSFPEPFKKEGMEIRFSGEQVEINPGERRYAMPLRLFSLSSAESKQ